MALEYVVNGRFLTRPATGVDRVAIEIICALAARSDVGLLKVVHPISDRVHVDWFHALPSNIREKVHIEQLGRLKGHLWEQFELVGVSPDRTLLSLCSTGPVLRRNQAVMVHDAQVWDAPNSYSLTFRFAYRALLPTLARTASHLLTVSRYSADRLESLGVAPYGKVSVVYNGADHMQRVQADPGTLARHNLVSGGYILTIGNLAPHKNLRRLVDAAVARGPGAPPLVIAGGKDAHVFADAGLPEAHGVSYIGRVSDGELRALYEGALALAFPSLTEGFGLPPVEAMLCGCPVLATTGGAVPEICGDAALYADPLDTSAWTSALGRIAYEPQLRSELIKRGRSRAATYTWRLAAAALVEGLR